MANMKRLREILLTQYIGAIMIGMLAAQAMMGLINTFVQAIAAYFAIQQSASVLGSGHYFSWRTPITSLIAVLLEFLTCAILIVWLYGGPEQSEFKDTPEHAGEKL